jgi:hypothetical protein
VARRAQGASLGGFDLSRIFNSQTVEGLLIAVISGALFWLVWIYGNGLRDPRYLDGWVLAGGMSLQVYFHIALKKGTLSPKAATRWRQLHIFLGYLLGAAFISHTNFSLPGSGYLWALWTGFVLVTLSGIFGTYLAWALKAKGWKDELVSYDRIPSRRVELAREVQAAVLKSDPAAAALALPAVPYDSWVKDLYGNHLREFFQGQRNYLSHLLGSQRPLKRLTDEIDNLSPYVDQQGQEKLAAIRAMVVEKDRLDFAHVYLGLSKGWLFVHVPVTYTLIVLAVLHVAVNYAFSGGLW